MHKQNIVGICYSTKRRESSLLLEELTITTLAIWHNSLGLEQFIGTGLDRGAA